MYATFKFIFWPGRNFPENSPLYGMFTSIMRIYLYEIS